MNRENSRILIKEKNKKVRKENGMRISMRAARANAGLSLQDIANSMHVSISTIHRWETGQSPIANDLFIVYCNLCKINPENVTANIKVKGDTVNYDK